MDIDLVFILSTAVKIILFTFVISLLMVAYATYAERRVSAIIQDRVGPNRTGIPLTLFGGKKDWHFFGLIQPIADGVKNLLKEDFTPAHVRKFFFWIAPALTLIPAFLCLAVIPFGSSVTLPTGDEIKLVIADIDIGPLFIFAIASLSVYGITIAGWASNNKYSFLGGVRSTAQMISYEIAMGLSIIPVLMVYGHLNLNNIVQYQAENGWLLLPLWKDGVFGFYLQNLLLWIPMFISFVIFLTAVFAETNRMPFDLPECETELVGGYHTEYSSMKFAMFFMGEYCAMIVGSALVVTLFFGGWAVGIPAVDSAISEMAWGGIIHLLVFLVKVVAFIVTFIWVRWTVPRFKFDQLMKLGWVIFFELAVVNIVIAALILFYVK